MTDKICKAHHWLIEEARGPTSKGRCINCGEEREFSNWYNHIGPRAWLPKEDRQIRDWEAQMDIMTHYEHDLMKQHGARRTGR